MSCVLECRNEMGSVARSRSHCWMRGVVIAVYPDGLFLSTSGQTLALGFYTLAVFESVVGAALDAVDPTLSEEAFQPRSETGWRW